MLGLAPYDSYQGTSSYVPKQPKRIRALAPAYGHSAAPFRSSKHHCWRTHLLCDFIYCRKNRIFCNLTVLLSCSSTCCINTARNTSICCTVSWSCLTTFTLCSRSVRSALNELFNSSKVSSHFGQGRSSGAELRSGSAAFRRSGFRTQIISVAQENTLHRIPLGDDWPGVRRSIPIHPHIGDSSSTRYFRG